MLSKFIRNETQVIIFNYVYTFAVAQCFIALRLLLTKFNLLVSVISIFRCCQMTLKVCDGKTAYSCLKLIPLCVLVIIIL